MIADVFALFDLVYFIRKFVRVDPPPIEMWIP
jgi:hypothetical protein